MDTVFIIQGNTLREELLEVSHKTQESNESRVPAALTEEGVQNI